jgi:hypothetical protein
MSSFMANTTAVTLRQPSFFSDGTVQPSLFVAPDAVFHSSDGTATVVDFKTAPEVAANAPRRGQLTTWPAIREFLFAGQAMFTLVSLKTGLRFTYKVRAKKQDVEELARRTAAGEVTEEGFVTYFCSLLRGPDNGSDFSYLGVIRKPGRFFVTSKSQVSCHAAAHKAIVWFLDEMKNERVVLGVLVEFWHTGRCGKCNRLLTVPDSVSRGIGPVCDGR